MENETFDINDEMKQIVEHFKDSSVPVTQTMLDTYCAEAGINPVTLGEYSDWAYGRTFASLLATIYPLIVAELAKIRHFSDYQTKDDRDVIKESNSDVEVAIARICVEHGVKFHVSGISEFELVLRNVQASVNGAIESVRNRVHSTAAETFDHIALQQLGSPLTLASIVRYHENIGK